MITVIIPDMQADWLVTMKKTSEKLEEKMVQKSKKPKQRRSRADTEQKLMVEMHGEKWYARWGYIEEDLKNIVTVTPKLVPEDVTTEPWFSKIFPNK